MEYCLTADVLPAHL